MKHFLGLSLFLVLAVSCGGSKSSKDPFKPYIEMEGQTEPDVKPEEAKPVKVELPKARALKLGLNALVFNASLSDTEKAFYFSLSEIKEKSVFYSSNYSMANCYGAPVVKLAVVDYASGKEVVVKNVSDDSWFERPSDTTGLLKMTISKMDQCLRYESTFYIQK